MAAPSANETFWGFVWYVTHNPTKTFGGMTQDDFLAMADVYQKVNTDAITDALTKTTGGGWVIPAGAYTDAEYPSTLATVVAAASSLTATNTTAVTDQAHYPDRHEGD